MLLRTWITYLAIIIGATGSAKAALIAVGPYTPSTTMPFVVPIVITGAIDLASFTFDLGYAADDVAINTACDPFSGDPHCDLFTGPITLGPFFGTSMFPALFNPGFVLLAPGGAQIGSLLGVNGAWQDPGSGPSGDGILAYVEFIALAGGDPSSPITVIDRPSAVPEPAPLALLVGMLGVMAWQRLRSGSSRPRRADARMLTKDSP